MSLPGPPVAAELLVHSVPALYKRQEYLSWAVSDLQSRLQIFFPRNLGTKGNKVMFWIPKATGNKTQGKSGDSAIKLLVCLKRGVQQRRSTYLQECIIIHSFNLIGTKSIIQRMALLITY